MANIAIIPARSGSKGLKNKNIKLLAGKPLLAYSIEAALASGEFDEVMVSTDSEEYATIARNYGANVPFLRSEATSSDSASSWDMVREVLAGYEAKGQTFTTFCLLQPTSPLRTAEDIKQAYALFREKQAISVVAMTELEHPLRWCGTLPENHSIDGFFPKDAAAQRQAQETYYRPNGAIYIASVPDFLQDDFLYRAGGYAYLMPGERSVDIDTEMDFAIAETILRFEEEKA